MDKAKDNIRKVDSDRESSEEREMRRAHKGALLSLRLELLLQQDLAPDRADKLSREIDEEFRKLPGPVWARFQRVRMLVEDQIASSQATLADITKELSERGAPINQNTIGDALFKRITAIEAGGETLATVADGGCLILMCANETDHRAVLRAYSPDVSDEFGGGCFIYRIKVPIAANPDQFVPLILILGVSQDEYKLSLIRHERQHNIHWTLLNNFALTEVQSGEDQEVHQPETTPIYRGIKDEMLAYTRDDVHSEGTSIVSLLKTKAYEHLFKAVDPKDRDEVDQTTAAAAAALEKTLLWRMGPQGKALLVSHLYTVPLPQFPQSLEAIDRYYRKREKDFGDFMRAMSPLPKREYQLPQHLQPAILALLNDQTLVQSNESLPTDNAFQEIVDRVRSNIRTYNTLAEAIHVQFWDVAYNEYRYVCGIDNNGTEYASTPPPFEEKLRLVRELQTALFRDIQLLQIKTQTQRLI